MPELLYELSTSDLMLYQELIQWALQWKRNGIELPDARKRRLAEVVDEIDRIVINRAAAGDLGSMEAAGGIIIRAPERNVLERNAPERKPATSAGNQQQNALRTGAKDK